MTVLAGGQVDIGWQPRYLWLAAISAALLLHGVVALFFWWQPQPKLLLAAAAAPVVFEVSMVAAPKAAATALPIGLKQQQSSPAPSSPAQQQRSEQVPIKASVEVSSLIKPLVNIQSQVVIKTPPPSPKKRHSLVKPPVEQKTPNKKMPNKKTHSKTKTPIEKKTPPKELLPLENKPQKHQSQDRSGDNTGEYSVAQSSAPLTQQAQDSDTVSAPAVGAFNQRESAAKLSWQNKLQAHLERRKRYPRRAQMLGQQGIPWVRFTINRAGKVTDVQLHRASGYADLDKEVVALVLRAQPLPAPPADVPGELLTLAVPVAFHRS